MYSLDTALSAEDGQREALPGLHLLYSALDEEFDRLGLGQSIWRRNAAPDRLKLNVARLAAIARQTPQYAGLAALYDLTDFAMVTITLALAPEVDHRYGELFAALQGNSARCAPTRGLALDLCCRTERERETARRELAVGGQLLQERILHATSSGVHDVDCGLVVDAQIRQLLLGEPGIDARLDTCCALVVPALALNNVPLSETAMSSVLRMAQAFVEGDADQLRLFLAGQPGCGSEMVAAALATVLGRPLLRVDLAQLLASKESGELSALLARECVLLGALVEVENTDSAIAEGDEVVRSLLPRLGPLVIATGSHGDASRAAAACGFSVIAIAVPDPSEREVLWARALAAGGASVDETDRAQLARRYQLLPVEIARAVTQGLAALAANPALTPLAAFAAAAREQTGHQLAELATRITPRFTWNDIVLTAPVEAQLRELCERAVYSVKVLEEWGFATKLPLGRGITALFAGPSGTGKTMAAEVIASELGLDLFKVNLATVVSKYIGETEQNLDRIFRAAERVNGILQFDEADALFGKRSEVRDARDRYANLEISYLLQKMEEFEGIAILSTNLHANLDDAFMRRLAFITYFPFPEAEERERLWRVVWPSGVPMEPIDFAPLAAAFKLSGGNIKQAALSATFYAASEGVAVSHRHVMRGIEREFQKLGRPLQTNEIVSFAEGWRAAS